MNSKINWAHPIINPLIISLSTILVYIWTIFYDFQFDDIANIRAYFYIRNETLQRLIFSNTRWISYWLNTRLYQLSEFNPVAYRTTNILLHLGAGILIYYIVSNALSRINQENYFHKHAQPLALITSLLFLLHPVQTQTVSYVIQGQLEGLAALFVFSVILLFLHATQEQSSKKKFWYFTALFIVGFLSTGTKEIAILSPVMLLLIDWFFVAQGNFKKLSSRSLFYLCYSSIIFVSYLYYLKPSFFKNVLIANNSVANNIGNVITQNPQQMITAWSYFISQFKVIIHYIGLFIWPQSMCVDYDWKLVESFWSPDCLGPLLLLILCAVGIFLLLKSDKTHVVGFAGLWFFIGLAPRSTIIPSTELLADYKTYFSSFGIMLFLAIILLWLFEQTQKLFKSNFINQGAFVLFACILALATYQRNLVWKDAQSFWAAVLQQSPLKARAHNNYGTALAEAGKHREALLSFKRATKLDHYYPDPWNNLAVTYDKLGNPDRAIETMKEALKLHLEYPEFYNNLGSFYLNKKEYDKTVHYCDLAIKKRKHYGKAYYNIGRAKFEQGNYEQAWQFFHHAVFKADYDTQKGFEGYVIASMKLDKYDDAILGCHKILQQNPNDPEALFNLANCHYCKGESELAEKYYLTMTKIKPDDLRPYYNLAELYLKTKGAKEALPYFEKAAPLQKQIPSVGTRLAECKKWASSQTHEKTVIS